MGFLHYLFMKIFWTGLLCFVCALAQAQDSRDHFADFQKYARENAALPSPAPGERRVVFMGSSVVEFWKTLDPAYFESHHYIDRGISGQVSSQMLVRFQADVVDLRPAAVVILAGSNDIAMDTAVYMYKRIMDNIRSMAELARAHGIKVILCKYVPIAEYPWRKGIRPVPRIRRLNSLVAAYADSAHCTLLDLFTPLADKNGGQQAAFTRDGVHPNLEGYRRLEPLTDKAIVATLKD